MITLRLTESATKILPIMKSEYSSRLRILWMLYEASLLPGGGPGLMMTEWMEDN